MGFLLTYQDLILLPTFEDRFGYVEWAAKTDNAIAAMKMYSGSED